MEGALNIDIAPDVIVIGSGLSGFAAASTLKRRGRKVAVVATGPGATSVSSGAWDFGPLSLRSHGSLEEMRASEVWSDIFSRLLVEETDLASASELGQAAIEVASELAPQLKIVFDFKRGFIIPTSSGRLKRAFGAQELQSRATLARLKGKRVALVAGENWRFRPDLMIRRWQAEAAAQKERIDIAPLWLHLNENGPDWPLPVLATRYHSDESFRRRLREAIDDRLHGSSFETLLFPPFFLDPRHADELARDLHIEVAEMLSTVEPVAGYRLRQAIAQSMSRLGIGFHELGQLQAETEDGRITKLRGYGQPAGWTELAARHYVLATGKFFGGGLKLGFETVSESIFNLPVFPARESREVRYRTEIPWSDRRFHDEQVWAGLGVWVDEKWRPIDRNRQPVLANLSACGSVVGGVDAARAGLGLGFMAYSGRQNAKRAS